MAEEEREGEQGEQTAQSDRELMAQLQEELRRLKVSDVLVQTVLTVSSLGFHKLESETRDLEQARLAVEALRALVPTLDGFVSQDAVRDFGQMLANLQLAYAKAATTEAEPATEAPEPSADEPGGEAPQPSGDG